MYFLRKLYKVSPKLWRHDFPCFVYFPNFLCSCWLIVFHETFKISLRKNFDSIFFLDFFPFIFISWRLITLQYYSGFCHTFIWIPLLGIHTEETRSERDMCTPMFIAELIGFLFEIERSLRINLWSLSYLVCFINDYRP